MPAVVGGGTAVLTDIRTGRHSGYEQVVLAFAGTFGSVRVGYVAAVHADPSDRIIPLRGSAFLQVAVQGAVARYAAVPLPRPYTGPSTVTPGYPTTKQVSISGDFEAVLSVGVGLDRVAGFRIERLRAPDRLVIDVASPAPAWRMWPDVSLTTARVAQAAFEQGHQPWRGDPVAVVGAYARQVYAMNSPLVAPTAPGTYRVSQRMTASRVDTITVHVARPFAATAPTSVFEVLATR